MIIRTHPFYSLWTTLCVFTWGHAECYRSEWWMHTRLYAGVPAWVRRSLGWLHTSVYAGFSAWVQSEFHDECIQDCIQELRWFDEFTQVWVMIAYKSVYRSERWLHTRVYAWVSIWVHVELLQESIWVYTRLCAGVIIIQWAHTGVHDGCMHECMQECIQEFMLSFYRSEWWMHKWVYAGVSIWGPVELLQESIWWVLTRVLTRVYARVSAGVHAEFSTGVDDEYIHVCMQECLYEFMLSFYMSSWSVDTRLYAGFVIIQ